jgi:hypothetical protein
MELKKLATSLFYSRLYYGAEIWLQQSLNVNNERKLNSVSKAMLDIVSKNKGQKIPFEQLHYKLNQPTPRMWANYASSKALHNTSTSTIPESIIHTLTMNSLTNTRFKGQLFTSTEKTKIGRNSLANRVGEISKVMDTNWMEMSRKQFKNFAKKKFIDEEFQKSN